MPKEVLDIVDTAVKIGLGALISGVVTYVVSNRNHKNEKKKSYSDKKIEVLEYATENVEPYIFALSNYVALVDGVLRQGKKPGKFTEEQFKAWGFEDDDLNFLESREKQAVATSRLRLIGAENLTNVLEEFELLENDFRQLIAFDLELPTPVKLDEFRVKFKELKINYFKELKNSFEHIYS